MTGPLHTDEPYPDIPLLRKAVEWVEAQDALPVEEREWRQHAWIAGDTLVRAESVAISTHRAVSVELDCGTKACVCGKIALDLGAEIIYDPAMGPRFNGLDPGYYGQEVLGLDPDEAKQLFDANNTAADVRRVAESIAARVGERL